MTHRDGLPHASRLGFSARSMRRGDAGHGEPRAPSTSIGPSAPGGRKHRPASIGQAAVPVAHGARQWAYLGASEGLDDAPHRLPPPSDPTGPMGDPYGSLSPLLGMRPEAG